MDQFKLFERLFISESDEFKPFDNEIKTVSLGETLLLMTDIRHSFIDASVRELIKENLIPVSVTGIGWRIVECIAHDGLGDSSQKLLDEEGCPVDELLMPPPTYGPIRPIALMRHQEAFSRFPAFKFPDRDRLHLNCGLQLCRGFCPKAECIAFNDNRLEVFNSIQVLAPEIDDLRQRDKQPASEPSVYPFTNISGDRTFCISPNKMAVTFCILGFIFLTAVIVAAACLLNLKDKKIIHHTTPEACSQAAAKDLPLEANYFYMTVLALISQVLLLGGCNMEEYCENTYKYVKE
ncbi:hypothetical protein NQ315_009449 [Exocentrus adspersus]|uniref:ZP domain-containing protein n=1 Tax=Exocentrus adspersus TaxID=1586481 RepID=A0AAV8WGC9_9CUCU|nr:hypothetical protein NQ315_009449 [Exocentrus adspersus]